MEEKRKYIRFDTSVKIMYKILSPADGIYSSHSKDLSVAGIRIEVEEEIPINAILGLELYLSPKDEPLRVKGEVVWQERLSEGERKYEVGIKFYEMGKEDLDRLSAFFIPEKTKDEMI